MSRQMVGIHRFGQVERGSSESFSQLIEQLEKEGGEASGLVHLFFLDKPIDLGRPRLPPTDDDLEDIPFGIPERVVRRDRELVELVAVPAELFNAWSRETVLCVASQWGYQKCIPEDVFLLCLKLMGMQRDVETEDFPLLKLLVAMDEVWDKDGEWGILVFDVEEGPIFLEVQEEWDRREHPHPAQDVHWLFSLPVQG